MARAPFYITVTDAAGNVRSGANVTIRRRADAALATVYASETGAGTLANPLSTDTAGRAQGYLDRGGYRADVAGSGIAAYTVPFDASPGADGAIDTTWLGGALPIGFGPVPYLGLTDPPGGAWMVCNGRAISRNTYSALFALIGSDFGAGDGTSTFNIPNMIERVAIPSGAATGLTTRTRGVVGGQELVALNDDQGPPGYVGADIGGQQVPFTVNDAGAGGAIGLEVNTAGAVHLNMQPYVTVGSAIIRVL